MKIKICGIKTIEEARWAIACGTDFLGFNFYPPSPRSISIEDCNHIVKVLRREGLNTHYVGVFVNMLPEKILEILEHCKLDLAQLSGDESLEDQRILAERAYKVLRLPKYLGPISLYEQVSYRKTPPALLVDASVPGQYGGTGQMADWETAATIAAEMPIFLAGGLTPENIAEAIHKVKPWGVDVASGVESAPGKKDSAKVKAFIQNAHQAFAELEIER